MKELDELRVEYAGIYATPDGTSVGPSLEEALAEHLKHYLPPLDECPMCGASRAAARWGLVHGEMACGECGYPATMYHFIGEGDDRVRLVAFLWAHPDYVRASAGDHGRRRR